MKIEHVLPSLLIAIDLSASVVYAFSGDLRKAIYWVAAAVLTASVTF